jgi:hypothetical protein
VDILERVLERLGTTESTTLALKSEVGGKIRITSLLWESPEVILRGEVLEVLNSNVEKSCICQDLERLAAMIEERQEAQIKVTRSISVVAPQRFR